MCRNSGAETAARLIDSNLRGRLRSRRGDGAWFDYTYANPASGVVETKHSWMVIHDGIYLRLRLV